MLKPKVQEFAHIHKQLLNIGAIQRRRLDVVVNVVVLLKLEGLFSRDLLLRSQVALGHREEDNRVCRALGVDLVEPVLQVVECVSRVDREAEQHRVRLAVEHFRHRAEVLLAGRVPDVQLAKAVFHAQQEGLKFNANRGVALQELVLSEPFQEAGFAAV